jgi:hypothetical protein
MEENISNERGRLMTDTTTGATPSKADIAWNVIKMVFHNNTINAQTNISDFFTPARLIFYQNLFNGAVATQIDATTPYRWVPVKDTEFTGITTAGALETVVEAHLTAKSTAGTGTGGTNA